MKWFVAFILLCCATGVLMQKRSLKANAIILALICVITTVGYFFFHQI